MSLPISEAYFALMDKNVAWALKIILLLTYKLLLVYYLVCISINTSLAQTVVLFYISNTMCLHDSYRNLREIIDERIDQTRTPIIAGRRSRAQTTCLASFEPLIFNAYLSCI